MELVTERLVLREFEESDWEAVLDYQRDPLYLRYVAWEGRSPDDARAFVGKFIAQQQVKPRLKYQWTVVTRVDGLLIGNAGIRREKIDDHEAEIGYEFAPRMWGRGYATEAATAVVAYGFKELGVHRVSAWCIAENAGSARVLEKLGMRLEGRQREKERFKGRWWDALLYAVLEQEWHDKTGHAQSLPAR